MELSDVGLFLASVLWVLMFGEKARDDGASSPRMIPMVNRKVTILFMIVGLVIIIKGSY